MNNQNWMLDKVGGTYSLRFGWLRDINRCWILNLRFWMDYAYKNQSLEDLKLSILDLFQVLIKSRVGAGHVQKTHNPKPEIQNLKLLNINHIVSEIIMQLTVDHKYSIRLEDFFKIWQTSEQQLLTRSEARQISHLLAVAAVATTNAESAYGYREAWGTEVEELNRKFLG